MINILEIESSKGWGGQEKRTARVINGLDKTRYKVYYGVAKDSQNMARKDEIDATFLELDIKKSYDIFAIFKVVSYIKKYSIDIISTHSGKDGWIGSIAGLLAHAKVIRTRHLQTPITSIISYNLATKVVSVSNQVTQYLISKGVKKDKCLTIYTGIDTEIFNPEIKTDLKKELQIKDKILVGIVAVLREAKMHKLLIESIKNIASIHLVIIGSGPQENNIREFIKELDVIDKVTILGHREDIDKILPSLDIFVLPSKMEALGTSILEASACGVPCVGSKVGGIPECIEDGVSGLLFESGDVEDLKNKIEMLIYDKKQREEFGKNARELVVEKFSTERMIQDTQRLYDGVMVF